MDRYDLRAHGAATNSRTIQSLGKKFSIGKDKSGNDISGCEGTKSAATGSEGLNSENLTRTGLHCLNLKTESSSSNSCHSYQDTVNPKHGNISRNGQTTDVSSIDLNEDFHGNHETDCYYYPRRALVSRPVPVLATHGSSVSVSPRLCRTGGGETRGWRGSAPTSAFRRTPYFFKKYRASSSRPSSIKGIDLNLPLASESDDIDPNDNSRKRAPAPGFRGLYMPGMTGLAFPGAFWGPGGDVAVIRPGFDLISRYHHEYGPMGGSLMEEQMRCFQQSAMSVNAFKRRELGVTQVNVNPWG